MKKIVLISLLLYLNETYSLNLPGPLVYVVTPSPKTPLSVEGRSAPAPFYYHNWIRRMDPPRNATTTTTTPDLIFAEFEPGNRMKSIRNLLEKEKIQPKTTITPDRPIYVTPASDTNPDDFELPLAAPVDIMKATEESTTPDKTDYFALYNNMYNVDSAPVYKPSTDKPFTTKPSTAPSTTKMTTTTAAPASNVQNIWQIIDSQKDEDYAGNWEVVANRDGDADKEQPDGDTNGGKIDDNFALPGFGTNPGNGAENESRAIHTEPNMRFPYVNLKPFQMKTQKKPNLNSNSISNSKKGNNLYTNLDNFYDLKNPVRGEANDVAPTTRPPIERYNPAQPYLPPPVYTSKSKQSRPSPPTKAVANLVPPPPPPLPKITDDDFPAPPNYESFPPFAPSGPPAGPPAPAASKPSIDFQPPDDGDDDSDDDLPNLSGYESFPPYQPSGPPKAPPALSPPAQYQPPAYAPDDSDDGPDELPTEYQPPIYKPHPPPQPYNKPVELPPVDDEPDFDGYHYSKPKPEYSPPIPDTYGKEYHVKPVYEAPAPYGYHYPTTTTTETPRVNRYSYYYLGKKLYYLPLYFSVYFIVYVGALIIKAVLRHKIVYPNSWRPNDQTAGYFSKRSVGSNDLSNEYLHEITGKVTHAIAVAGEKYFNRKKNK